MTPDSVLAIDALSVSFPLGRGRALAVRELSYEVGRGEVVGVVGESGCGKSVTALAIMRLLKSPPAAITARSIRLAGRELTALDEAGMRRVRGNDVAMIFQEPMTSLNPVLTIGEQIAEALRAHKGLGWREGFARAVELLGLVRIPDPAQRVHEYPHQMSGGMRQRAMIAMALACEPKLLIADEPTTALDVTIQAQILRLMRELQARLGMAIVMITHDLGVVAEMAHRVVVMYAGRKVEEGPIEALFARPRHPYTVGLMRSRPRLGGSLAGTTRARLTELPGQVPSLRDLATPGCAFAPRCALAEERCRVGAPPIEQVGARHLSACWRASEVEALHAGAAP
jgi:peptide/nickel transport system ATP-binding protein